MNAFIKTRPIPITLWHRFLVLSHFWRFHNFVLPLVLCPIYFILLPFSFALILILFSYFLSVVIGIFVMYLKHSGNYVNEKSLSVNNYLSFQTLHINNIFAIQYKSLLRSKRLRNIIVVTPIVCLIYYISFSLNDVHPFYKRCMLYIFNAANVMSITQLGFGIESNFYSAIYTKGISSYKLLLDKYKLCIMNIIVSCLVCVPICLFCHDSIFTQISFALYCCGFLPLPLLVDPFMCVPIDLFGPTFFNYQGSFISWKPVATMVGLAFLSLGLVCSLCFVHWLSQIILSVLGIIGFSIHHQYFMWIDKKFIANKYEYMNKYLIK